MEKPHFGPDLGSQTLFKAIILCNFEPHFGLFGLPSWSAKVFSWVLPILDVRHCCQLSLHGISRKTYDLNSRKWRKNLILGLIQAHWAHWTVKLTSSVQKCFYEKCLMLTNKKNFQEQSTSLTRTLAINQLDKFKDHIYQEPLQQRQVSL